MKQWIKWLGVTSMYAAYLIGYFFGGKENRVDLSLLTIVAFLFIITLNTNKIKD